MALIDDLLWQPRTEVHGSDARTAPIVRAIDVHRVLGTKEVSAHILKSVNLSIDRSEYVSIVGPSGSGKSTLLYLLGGLDRPSRAMSVEHGGRWIERPFDPLPRVLIDQQDTNELNDTQLALLRNEKVGFVFQFHYLLKEFTAQENVCMPMFKLGRWSKSDALDRGAQLLKQLDLGDKIKRRANRLSGGEQQRVAIARAIANEPAVLLADEPTGNLDKKNADRVADTLDQLAGAGGRSVVIVTHDLNLAARARRQIRMEDGRVIHDSAADSVR